MPRVVHTEPWVAGLRDGVRTSTAKGWCVRKEANTFGWKYGARALSACHSSGSEEASETTAARQERLRTGLRGSHAERRSRTRGDSLSSKQDGLGGVAGWLQTAHPKPGQPGVGQDLEQQLPTVP